MLLTRHNFGVSLKNIYQNDFWERYYICLRKENDIAMWCFIKKNTSIKNDGYWKRTYHDNFLEESMTFLVWKMVMLLAWCYVPRVMFLNWNKISCLVRWNISPHISDENVTLLPSRKLWYFATKTMVLLWKNLFFESKWTVFFEKCFITDFWRKCDVFNLKHRYNYILKLKKVMFCFWKGFIADHQENVIFWTEHHHNYF